MTKSLITFVAAIGSIFNGGFCVGLLFRFSDNNNLIGVASDWQIIILNLVAAVASVYGGIVLFKDYSRRMTRTAMRTN